MARRLVPLLFVACFALLVLAFAGCGGDGDSSASEDTVATETTTTEETTEEETTEETTEEEATEETTTEESSDSGAVSAEDCQEFAEATAEISGALSGTADVGELQDTFEALTAAAPDEIKDDFQVLADYVTDIAEVVGDGTPSAEDAQALASLDATAVTAASQNIATWATENCTGVTP
jgi:hypothetical protein